MATHVLPVGTILRSHLPTHESEVWQAAVDIHPEENEAIRVSMGRSRPPLAPVMCFRHILGGRGARPPPPTFLYFLKFGAESRVRWCKQRLPTSSRRDFPPF